MSDHSNREAIALERIADALDNIAALLASQRVPAGSAHPAGNGDDEDDEGWIEWSGGKKCPVSQLGKLVDVRLRNGVFLTGTSPYDLDWWNDGDEYDIVAYRRHKP